MDSATDLKTSDQGSIPDKCDLFFDVAKTMSERNVVCQVLGYFLVEIVCQEEKKSGSLHIPLEQATLRTAQYAGLSIATCKKFAKLTVSKPKKHRKPRKDRIIIDSFDRNVIRRTVHEMIAKGSEIPTAKSIFKRIKERIDFPGQLTYLRTLLKELGFVWKKCESNRTVLMERTDVAVVRINYLRAIKKFRDEGRTIVYTDETYVHTSHCMKKCWQSSDVSMSIPFSRGERLIVVHAGSPKGFIPGACLLFKAHTSSGDYHSEMNGNNFQKWLTEKLIPNLPPRSVVIVDNAAYHNLQEDKCPSQCTKKADIISWMERNQIPHTPNLLKPELLELCKRHKPAPRYVLDTTLQKYGHDCLRLPQYHAELNAIELIWSQVKGRIAAMNASFKMKDVLKMTEEAIGSITAKEWEDCCRHVQEVEERFWRTDVSTVERAVEQFIVAVSDEEATDTAFEDEDCSDTDTAFEM